MLHSFHLMYYILMFNSLLQLLNFMLLLVNFEFNNSIIIFSMFLMQYVMCWRMKTHYNDPLWGVTLYYFPKVCMLSVSHLKFFKEFHNFFAYYIRIQPRKDIKNEIISFHFIKWEIIVYLWKYMQCTCVFRNTNILKNNFNDF